MDKKAFEIQFNWIFVLVAGAAILLFFTSVVVKQKSVGEISTKTTVLKSIEAIIAGASVTIDTTKPESIPNSNIEFGCNKVSISGGAETVSKQYQNLILFAPSLIKGDKFTWQTMAFSTPYRATNLLFITSPQLRYIIIGSNALASEINKSLPVELKKEFYQSFPEIKNSNNYKVRFVVSQDDMIGFPKALEKMPDSDVTAIKFNGDIEKGNIEFWQKDGTSWSSKGSSFYMGKSSLIGAVYTDSLGVYECNMQNVFSRLNLVTKIYTERTNKLLQKVVNRDCNQFYNNALASLNSIFTASLKFDKQNLDTISGASKLLSDDNKNAQTYSCPLIY